MTHIMLVKRVSRLVLCASFFTTGSALGQGTSASSLRSSEVSKEKLISAMEAKDWMLRRRAVQEFLRPERRAQRSLSSLLELAKPQVIEVESYGLVKALADLVALDQVAVAKTLAYSDGDAAELLCCAISRNSKVDDNLVAALDAIVRKEHVSTNAAVASRIALASLNVRRDENMKAINECLVGKSGQVDDVLQIMLLARVGPWAVDWLSPEIEILLRQRNDRAPSASLLAALWKERGKMFLPLIRKNAEQARGSAFVIYRFAGAKLASTDSIWLTPDLMKILSGEQAGFDHTMASACVLISDVLLGEPEISALARVLESHESGAVIGALILCRAVGIPAQRLEGQLLALVEMDKDERIRALAASALGSVGSERSIPRLRAAAAKENVDQVREAVHEAIRLISLSN